MDGSKSSRIEVGKDYEGEKKNKAAPNVDFLPKIPEGHQPRKIVDTEYGPAIRHVVTPEDAKRQVEGATVLNAESDGPKIFSPRDDPRYQGILEGRCCNICVHHDKDMAAQAMLEQNFIERLIHDERWKADWFDDWRIWGICKAFYDGKYARIVHGDAPATCAASDVDSDKKVGSSEGMEQIPCPHFRNTLEHGDTMHASAAGVFGPTKSGKGLDYIRKHEAERSMQDKAEGVKRRFEVAKSRLQIRQQVKKEK